MEWLRRVNWRAVDLARVLAQPNARCATSPQRIQAALGQRGSCVCSGAELGRMALGNRRVGLEFPSAWAIPKASGNFQSQQTVNLRQSTSGSPVCIYNQTPKTAAKEIPVLFMDLALPISEFTRKPFSAVGFWPRPWCVWLECVSWAKRRSQLSTTKGFQKHRRRLLSPYNFNFALNAQNTRRVQRCHPSGMTGPTDTWLADRSCGCCTETCSSHNWMNQAHAIIQDQSLPTMPSSGEDHAAVMIGAQDNIWRPGPWLHFHDPSKG